MSDSDELLSRLEDLRDNAFVLDEEVDEVGNMIDSGELDDAESMIDDLESDRS